MSSDTKETSYTQMKRTKNPNSVFCDACQFSMHSDNYPIHIRGRKHVAKQQQIDKINKSIFVNFTGATKLTPQDLKSVFSKYGEVSQITKPEHRAFAFIQFSDETSVKKALEDRIFAGGMRLFTRKYEDHGKKKENYDISKQLSETTSNSSQGIPTANEIQELLPVKLIQAEDCPPDDNFFENQVDNFISQVELPLCMFDRLSEVTRDVEQLFEQVLPGCRVLVFGSVQTGLAFKDSDLDLFIQCEDDEQSKNFVWKEARLMFLSKQMEVKTRIFDARVPIVRFIHLSTGWKCDLSACSRLGVCNTSLVKFLISLDPKIRPLMLVLKYWARWCGISGFQHGFSTYSLVMLIVFYLQQQKILPTIHSLQRLQDNKEFCQGWECSFSVNDWDLYLEGLIKVNTLSLRDLLAGFFAFYRNFDFTKVICPLIGEMLPASDFEDTDKLPDEMRLYKERAQNEDNMQFRTNVMVKVQDPIEWQMNITRNVTDKTCRIFQKGCLVSSELCEKSKDCDLLMNLFSIEKASLDDSNNCFKFNLPYKSTTQWYETCTKALLLVMREVLKLQIEPIDQQVSSNLKKVNSQLDVHSLGSTTQNAEVSTYRCTGYAAVWNSRKKTSKLLRRLGISASGPFEREIRISHFLYKPSETRIVFFTLTMTSSESFKKERKGIEVVISDRSQGSSDIKEMVYFLNSNLLPLTYCAINFIENIKQHVKEIKMKNLFI